jgi:hypothetical protein
VYIYNIKSREFPTNPMNIYFEDEITFALFSIDISCALPGQSIPQESIF